MLSPLPDVGGEVIRDLFGELLGRLLPGWVFDLYELEMDE